MQEEAVRVGAERKLVYVRRLLLLGRAAEEYAADKRTLKMLLKISEREKKAFRSSAFPFSDADRGDLNDFLSELGSALKSMVKAKKVEEHRLASNALNRCLVQLSEEESRLASFLQPRETVEDMIKKATSTIGEAIGKGVAGVKKTIKGLGSG